MATRTTGRAGTGPVEKARVPALDGLRGLCALAVLIFHVSYSAGVMHHFADPRDNVWGHLTAGMGVFLPPFFILSGLMLYLPFARRTMSGEAAKQPVLPFLWRRVLRIVPAFWLVTVVAILTLNFDKIDSAWYVLRPLLMVHFFVRTEWIVGLEPTWTVPAEMVFYLSLPAVAWVVHKIARGVADPARRMRRMLLPIGALVLVGSAWTAYCFLPSMTADVWYLNFFPFGYIGFFAGGMGLAVLTAYSEVTGRVPALYRAAAKRPLAFWAAAVVAYALNVPQPFGNPGMGDWGALTQQMVMHVLFFAFAMLLVIPVVAPGAQSRTIDAVVSNRPMVFLGRISYGIYLWHVFFVYVILQDGSIFGKTAVPDGMIRGQVGFWPMFAFSLAASVVAALVSHYALEQPLSRKLRRIFDKPAAAPAPAAPASVDTKDREALTKV
ncbi:Acyltransferase family protein [Streptomyces sp. ADI91-18]|uniref:acyltransferase family protein n=1 Tax=Streptomyces sp. ADI91-18 TaxID=1522755 RepID=UPI000F551D26|nr:acyltransferase [Streptomyces sp. ADI91-18]RPK24624.1 Acyltransferase family protein [Streptomyces sp. ADI91-18]